MPSAGLEPATPGLGGGRCGPLSYEGMLPAARQREVIIDIRRSGRSSARLECTVRDREVGGSNPLAPTILNNEQAIRSSISGQDGADRHDPGGTPARADAIEHLPDERLLESAPHNWTGKDLLAHMAWWHDHSVLVLEGLRSGRQ